jgi:hypothetical protein
VLDIAVSYRAQVDGRAERPIPEVILLDAANGPKFTNLGSGTQYLDANMSPYFDSSVLIVGELGRCGIRIPSDLLWDQLDGVLSTFLLVWLHVDCASVLTWVDTKMRKGPASAKKPC